MLTILFLIAVIVPSPTLQLCFGQCTCGAGELPSVIKCVPEITNTGQSCANDLDCIDNPEQKYCLNSTSTCWECLLGVPSLKNDGTLTCTRDKVGDLCRRKFGPQQDMVHQPCTGEYQRCDYDSSMCQCNEEISVESKEFPGSCTLLPKLGENCNITSGLCAGGSKEIGYTKCSSSGICICVGDYVNQYCQSVLNGECKRDEDCPENSECKVASYYEDDKKCRCRGDYFEAPDGKCRPLYHKQACSDNPDQKSIHFQGVRCINGYYACEFPMEQEYENGVNRCLGKVGSHCLSSLYDDKNCTKNSSCVEIDGDWKCRCDPGYSVSPDNICLLDFKSPCNMRDQLCNNFAGLTCINGGCQCSDNRIMYNQNDNSCQSSYGYFCGKKDINGQIVYIACEKGLRCIHEFKGDGTRCRE